MKKTTITLILLLTLAFTTTTTFAGDTVGPSRSASENPCETITDPTLLDEILAILGLTCS